MPKYQVELTITCDFEFDTDDVTEQFKEADIDPNDEDQVHDWLRSEDPEDLIQSYASGAMDLQNVRIEKAKTK